MTHSRSEMMRPVSSATGMNCAGETMPWPGWFQRSKASVPMMRPLFNSSCGWKWSREFVAFQRVPQAALGLQTLQ